MSWRVWIEPKQKKFIVRRRDHRGNNLPSKTCSTKALANQLKKKWKQQLELQDLGFTDPHRLTAEIIQEYYDELEKADQLNTLHTVKSILPKFMDGLTEIGQVSTETIQTYRSWLIKNCATATVQSRLRHVSSFLTWCRKKGYISKSPFIDIAVPTYEPQPKYLTDDEIKALDRVATGNLKILWRLAYTSGLRQKNSRMLRGDQIEDGVAYIQKTKGKRPIGVPLSPLVLELLPKPLPTGYLFPEYATEDDRWTLGKAFRALRKVAGVRDEITWHMARHTFVKKALQAGLTTFEVMTFTGHVSPISMKPYAHFEMERLRQRHKRIKFPVGI